MRLRAHAASRVLHQSRYEIIWETAFPLKKLQLDGGVQRAYGSAQLLDRPLRCLRQLADRMAAPRANTALAAGHRTAAAAAGLGALALQQMPLEALLPPMLTLWCWGGWSHEGFE